MSILGLILDLSYRYNVDSPATVNWLSSLIQRAALCSAILMEMEAFKGFSILGKFFTVPMITRIQGAYITWYLFCEIGWLSILGKLGSNPGNELYIFAKFMSSLLMVSTITYHIWQMTFISFLLYASITLVSKNQAMSGSPQRSALLPSAGKSHLMKPSQPQMTPRKAQNLARTFSQQTQLSQELQK